MFEDLKDMVYDVPEKTKEEKVALHCSSKICVGASIVNGSELEKIFNAIEREI